MTRDTRDTIAKAVKAAKSGQFVRVLPAVHGDLHGKEYTQRITRELAAATREEMVRLGHSANDIRTIERDWNRESTPIRCLHKPDDPGIIIELY
jgi:hypothetical protein